MKRIRIREFFKDYDNLRKGIVSESQVTNCSSIPLFIDFIGNWMQFYLIVQKSIGCEQY